MWDATSRALRDTFEVLLDRGLQPRAGVRPFERYFAASAASVSVESGCLGMQPKVGGKLHRKAKYWHESDSGQVP